MDVLDVIETIKKDGLKIVEKDGSYEITHELLEKDIGHIVSCEKIQGLSNDERLSSRNMVEMSFKQNFYASVPDLLLQLLKKLPGGSDEYEFVEKKFRYLMKGDVGTQRSEGIRIGKYSEIVDITMQRERDREQGLITDKTIDDYISGKVKL